jgi:HlyD family secretion protein
MDNPGEFKQKIFSNTKKIALITISIITLLIIGMILPYHLKFNRKSPPNTSPSPTPIPSQKAVSALGRIEPIDEVIKLAPSPKTGGSKVIKLLVKEGDLVSQGQTLAILDNYEQELANVEKAKREIQVNQANLEIVKAGAKQGEINAQKATIERLEAQLRGEIATNEAKIAKLNAQLTGEKQGQMATIERLQAELKNAEIEFNRYQKLEKDGAISISELDDRNLTLDTAIERLKEAQANLSKTVATLGEEIRETQAIYDSNINTLTKQIEEAKAQLAKISEVRAVDVAKAEAEVKRAIASLRQAQTDLALTHLKAPATGQVLKIHAHPGEKISDSEGALDLGKTTQMIVIAEVYESDISKIKIGQKATIISQNQTFPGEIQGEVYHIGQQIGKKDVLDADPAADVDARVVEVKILLDRQSSQQVSSLTYAQVLVKIFRAI